MKKIKITILNLSIIIIAIICYSPGLLALRPTDSFFRAGLSILIGIFLISIFIIGNRHLIEGPEHEWIPTGTEINTDQAEMILKGYYGGSFGNLAKTAAGQIERLKKISNRAEKIIGEKFNQGSISWQRYISVVKSAEDVLTKNIVRMANRMQMFDEEEYKNLQHYKEDDIPDDIQEEQISIYNRNIGLIKDIISANEKILVKMDVLAMELAEGNTEDEQDILDTIKRLAEEAKYYN